MDPQAHKTLFKDESLKGGGLSNFLGNLSVDDFVKKTIV